MPNEKIYPDIPKVRRPGRTRFYNFKFSDGHMKSLAADEWYPYCNQYCQLNDASLTENGITIAISASKTKRMRHDAFKPGFQPGLGEYVSCPGKYREKCKEKGLVEVGNESVMEQEKPESEWFDDETLKMVHDEGLEIGSNLEAALKSGDLV